MMERFWLDLDEQQRRGLQEYIFDLEEIRERAEDLTIAHEKLKRSQDLLLTVMSCTIHGLCLIKDDTFVWCNKAFSDIFGWEHEVLVGQSLDVLCPDPEEQEKMRSAIHGVLQPGGLVACEYEFCHQSGYRVPCLLTGRALDEGDPSRNYVLSITDFTERKRSREALWNAYEELGQRNAQVMLANERLNREIQVRQEAEERLDRHREHLEELVRMRTAELTAINEQLRQEIDERRRAQEELKKTNEELSREAFARREVEAALRKSENEYRAIFENTGTAMAIVERDATISLANAEFERLTGYCREEIEHKRKWTGFVVEDDLEKMTEQHGFPASAPEAVPQHREFRLKNRAGGMRDIFLTIAPIPDTRRNVASLLDVTDQKRMEAEVLKAQKLESLGILAGGIAHDFNNILTAIIGNLSLARMYTKPGDKVFIRLEETEKASLRARDLTRQLLTFSKGGKPVKKTVSLGNLIGESAVFALRGSRARLELSISEGLWPVEVDEGQFNQVIYNLVINADQAMPRGGVIDIGAENATLTGTCGLPVPTGKYVKMSVRDQGDGISEENIDRIFDPFYTTRHEGSGLGLATVYSVINRHGGYVKVDSSPGSGSTFHVFLPASGKSLSLPETGRANPIMGNGRILLMDDEEVVKDVVGEMLKYLGYNVAFALNGTEAVEMYRTSKVSGEAFDAVIMDLTIPGGMGGKEAVGHLLEIDTRAKVIASSGYSQDPVMGDYTHYGFVGVVSKPYRIEDLSTVLHDVLVAVDSRGEE